MQIGRIEGTTRILGRQQGFAGLPIREHTVNEKTLGMTPAMTSAWHPPPAELAALNAGAAVHVSLLGAIHPPIIVDVGPIPREEPPPP